MQWGCGLISLPFLSVVSLTVQISKAWATPRLVSLKGLILIFQQAFPFPYVPFIRESPPPPRPEKKTGGYIIRGKPSVPFCGFVTSGSHETSVMRDQHHALRDQRFNTCTALHTLRTCTGSARDGGKKSCSSRRWKCSQRASLWL